MECMDSSSAQSSYQSVDCLPIIIANSVNHEIVLQRLQTVTWVSSTEEGTRAGREARVEAVQFTLMMRSISSSWRGSLLTSWKKPQG